MPHADLEGVSLHYQLAGQGEPVVLVPGFVTTLRLYDGQMEELSRHHRTIRYDLRGQGESSAPTDGYAVDDHARDLGRLIDHLNLPRVHLVGASLGGAIALHFALAHPESVRSLTLAGAVVDGYPDWPAEYTDRLRRARKLAKSDGPDAALKDWLTHPFFAGTRELPLLAGLAVRAAAPVWTGAAKGPEADRTDWQRLAELAPPTQVLVGEADVQPVQKIAAGLKAAVPRVSFHTVAGAAHLPAWDRPEEFNRLLLEFLAGLSRK
jgi:3-oxoadipate enol-lactonase